MACFALQIDNCPVFLALQNMAEIQFNCSWRLHATR